MKLDDMSPEVKFAFDEAKQYLDDTTVDTVAVVSEAVKRKFGVDTREAISIAQQAFDAWVNVYYPD